MSEHEHVITHISGDDVNTIHERHEHDGGEVPHHHPDADQEDKEEFELWDED